MYKQDFFLSKESCITNIKPSRHKNLKLSLSLNLPYIMQKNTFVHFEMKNQSIFGQFLSTQNFKAI